jgi:Tfp pilus assembly protein PilE
MKQIKSKKAQRGLSLLMTMALVAIIGILAEVALSAYQDHVAQAKAAEAVTSEKIRTN